MLDKPSSLAYVNFVLEHFKNVAELLSGQTFLAAFCGMYLQSYHGWIDSDGMEGIIMDG